MNRKAPTNIDFEAILTKSDIKEVIGCGKNMKENGLLAVEDCSNQLPHHTSPSLSFGIKTKDKGEGEDKGRG